MMKWRGLVGSGVFEGGEIGVLRLDFYLIFLEVYFSQMRE